MDATQQDKRRRLVRVWRVANPVLGLLAGLAPWLVAIETTGRKTGLARRTPVATGVRDGDAMWLIATHGRHAHYVRNLEAEPRVRWRHHGRWREGTATLHPMSARSLSDFNPYARFGMKFAIDPVLVKVSPRS